MNLMNQENFFCRLKSSRSYYTEAANQETR